MIKKMRLRGFSGQPDETVTKRETDHRLLAKRAAAEGFVLLKNEDQTLPLKAGSRIGLYGAGAQFAFIGGTGSGDVNERDSVSILDGLAAAGYEISSESWLDAYADCFTRARQAWRDDLLERTSKAGADKFFDLYSASPFYAPAGPGIYTAAAAEDGADTAVYVISRIAGENADRKTEKGDYYLTDEEQLQLSSLCDCYERLVLVINSGSIIDLGFTDALPKIKAIIYMVQAGQEGGSALADVISGKVSPSGKLTDSWALRYEDYPNASTFSSRSGLEEEVYHEGIYVGYRYFDTFDVPVKYSFGYGLSYTAFKVRCDGISIEDADDGLPWVRMTARVLNAGKTYAGKAVVQIYAACPQGKEMGEYRRLAAFVKTEELAPGQMQLQDIRFRMDQLMHYDEEAAAWVLEGGLYGLFIGQSLADARICGAVSLDETCLIRQCKNVLKPAAAIDELKPDVQKLAEKTAQWQELLSEKGLSVAEVTSKELLSSVKRYKRTENKVPETVRALVDTLSDEQLMALAIGDPSLLQPEAETAFGQIVPGAAALTSEAAAGDPWNIASIVLADGPAGLRLTMEYAVNSGRMVKPHPFGSVENGFFADSRPSGELVMRQYCTALPVGTLLAQTWNPDLIREIGQMIGSEMQLFNVSLWLAPGMNIHRNPLCGRNFEYFSEDPLLSGIMAAAMTAGVQSVPGCGTTIKHFACNNQEDNRLGSDSILNERALREIYLKGFEIAVRFAQPMALMTSYNMINGIHAANSRDLCTELARNEWGFAGTIMTDWTTTTMSPRGECTAAGCIRAGNDWIMPGDEKDFNSIREALADGSLGMEQLKECVCRIVCTILQTNQYEDAISYSDRFDSLYAWMK